MQINKMNESVKTKAVALKHKEKGFSLPSVIVGSIIAAILGTIGLSTMWDSVDKATISAEKSTISEVKTMSTAIMEQSLGFPSTLGVANDNAASNAAGNLPSDLKYEIALVQNGTTSNTDDYLVLKATANDATGAEKIQKISESVYTALNGVAPADATVANTGIGANFAYNSTCSAPGTFATNQTDCFYISKIATKTSSVTTVDITNDTSDGTTPALINTATIAAGNVSLLN